MEILSTGEKVKRARIYKGYTLKELCNSKISISKMSCIENDKIKPEDWILEFLSDKLEISFEYLKLDIKNQIIKNIDDIEKKQDKKNYEKNLVYNFKFAERYNYDNICFRIIHLLFNYYLEKSELEKLYNIIVKYYEYLQKNFSKEKAILYYMDVGKYFFKTKEFSQAINYYDNVLDIAAETGSNELLGKITYNKIICFIALNDYEKAYELSDTITKFINMIDGDIKKAKVYHILAILSLKNDTEKFKVYEKKANEFYKDNLKDKSTSMVEYAEVMFTLNMSEKAVFYINEALKIHPKEHAEEFANFVIKIVGILIKNQIWDIVESICNIALDCSIKLNDIVLIERAYYYKALIFIKKGQLAEGEMYMNLSLDALSKFQTNICMYERYMEIGCMYYDMKKVQEALKYFNIAIDLKQKYNFL
ncbi:MULTISPECIES: helix-turn-helix domain-containing protein [Clostridium]|uniref:Predicted transcriptional regulator n=3 Tax=Clostridium TaxID=1485 RepID=D8GN74_CLOLD|nr:MULTISPECIES: helix-turn-helix transcriptional regulator [Clostridium]ADK13698.1 predicted transcriptional regulator [Clostridium ljungdahlii DSM 13528]OAA84475.1 Tetratricopeptide repeat protein [Clostridium ljungdahlii DSM 13528]OAA92824.1 Tetratricopeptide repeat protein [Clostridium coskatii]OBR92131.1 tetratricopeptide repeat protein [Clostridium coskatii]QXE19862.1 transcriptional regulator [Clostridium sp. 001]